MEGESLHHEEVTDTWGESDEEEEGPDVLDGFGLSLTAEQFGRERDNGALDYDGNVPGSPTGVSSSPTSEILDIPIRDYFSETDPDDLGSDKSSAGAAFLSEADISYRELNLSKVSSDENYREAPPEGPKIPYLFAQGAVKKFRTRVINMHRKTVRTCLTGKTRTKPTETDSKLSWVELVKDLSPEIAYELRQITDIFADVCYTIKCPSDKPFSHPGREYRILRNPLTSIPKCAAFLLTKWAKLITIDSNGTPVLVYGATALSDEHFGGKVKTTGVRNRKKRDLDANNTLRRIAQAKDLRDFISECDQTLDSIKLHIRKIETLEGLIVNTTRRNDISWRVEPQKNYLNNLFAGWEELSKHLVSMQATNSSLEATPDQPVNLKSYEYDNYPQEPAPADTKLSSLSEHTTEETFPTSFYPASQIPMLKAFLYDPNTLWLLVLLLCITSGYFAGLAFHSDNPYYTPVSQLFRLYAGLWCMVIPLYRDKALPIWPGRLWFYGFGSASATLCLISVGLCGTNKPWSEVIMGVAEFAGIAATALLAMGIGRQAKTRSHLD